MVLYIPFSVVGTWECVVSNPLKRARKYRDLADECLRVSELAPTAETKAEYRLIASHYVTLAEAEESLACQRQQRASAPTFRRSSLNADLDEA
jgi:hypothetical protein